jgi:hypothetical protein
MNELSKVQSDRKKNGEKWQHKILSISSSKWENCKLRLDDLETTKTWNCDLVNHKDKIFLELTTSAKDGKESKVILESRVYKHHYPDYKFVVGIKKIPKDSIRKSDGLNSVVDHLNQTPTIDQVLIGEEEILKFMNKPFYNKKITINNKPTGVVMTSSTLLMDTILHGASMGNTDGVTKLVEMMSTSKPKPPKSKPKGKTNQASARKREYFMDTLQRPDLVSEPTMSTANVLVKMGKDPKDFERFMQSKEATAMMNGGVKMIHQSPTGNLSERYHLKVSDVDKYVS